MGLAAGDGTAAERQRQAAVAARGRRRGGGNINLHSIILSAGQGRRLLPHTATQPKCLLKIAGHTVLERQLLALQAAGIRSATIVTGFGASLVDDELRRSCPAGFDARTLENPLYATSDNLVSCLAARGAMDRDFLLVNGDTLFQPGIASRLVASRPAPLAMAVATKPSYDADDMKVQVATGRVCRVGKDLHAGETDGEAIGLCLMRGEGPRLFVDSLERIASEPGGESRWYLSAINVLAGLAKVEAVSINGFDWIEIDYPQDLVRAREVIPTWPAIVAKTRKSRATRVTAEGEIAV